MLITKFSSFILLISWFSFKLLPTTAFNGTSPIVKANGYRLPTTTAPRLYKINIDLHIENDEFTFDGICSILFQVLKPTRSVIVHVGKLIEIDKAYTDLVCENHTIFKPIAQKWNLLFEFFDLKFNRSLEVGNYTVKFKFRGYHSSTLRGVYRATNFNKNGNPEYMVATHFQPTAARAAFPCWDEPALKAEFEIALKHWPNYTALSNMPVKKKITDDGGKIWTIFERSPLMSTYLVAFVVAAYDRHVNNYGNVTMWVHRDKYDEAKVSFDFSQKVIPAMENYTGISYSFPKLDQSVIPEYSSLATEHWGLISYGYSILYSPQADQLFYKDRAMLLTAHEIVHQWFGNLVTPIWWSDIWLSEAFAVYFEYKIMDMIFNDWHAMDLFATEIVSYTSFNAEYYSRWLRPIRWIPNSPEEIMQTFTYVTYRKGAAVLHMLEHIVTPEIFQTGLRMYLAEHQYGTATTDDLWAALQRAYDKERIVPHLNLKEIMDLWVEQTGYPLLNVTRDYKTGCTTITQINADDVNSKNRWTIPINFVTKSRLNFTSTRPTHWLQRTKNLMLHDDVNENNWIILNVQQTGFYRVNYDDENWRRIAEYLNSDNYKNIHVLNRAQLLRDIFYVARKESRYYELVVDVVFYLHRETNYLAWIAISKEMKYFSQIFIGTNSYDTFAKMMLHLMDNFIRHIGVEIHEDTNHLSALAIIEFLPWVCAFGHEECRAVARRKFNDTIFNNTTERIDPNTQSWIYCYGLMAANETVWDQLMSIHFANPQQPGFDFLGCTEDHNLMRKYLDTALNENSTYSVNRSNPLLDGLSSILVGGRENVDFALDYVIEYIDAIVRYCNRGNETNQINMIIAIFMQSIKTPRQYSKFVTFLNKWGADGKLNNTVDRILQLRRNMKLNEEASKMFNSIIEKKALFANIVSQ